MLEGSYDIALKSPMGLKKGRAIVISEGQGITGTIEILNNTNQFVGRIFTGGSFEAYGELKTATGQVTFNVKGRVEKDAFCGTMNTSKGEMEITGKRKRKE